MIFNHPTLITITAPTCSGKTYLIEHLEKLGLNRIVGFTTREPRAGEVHGVDYYFISREEADRLEHEGLLAETAEFRGNRYGVTHDEMENKVNRSNMPPVIILEPQGLESYIKYCRDKNWDIFKVFVTVPEKTKINRLNERTTQDLQALDCQTLAELHASIAKIVKTHSDRLMSITGDERLWQSKQVWEAVVPGDDVNKAINMIQEGIKWQNSRKSPPNTLGPDLRHRVLTSFMRGT